MFRSARAIKLAAAGAAILSIAIAGVSIAAVIKAQGGAVNAVYTATSSTGVSTDSHTTGWVDVPDMSVSFSTLGRQYATYMLVITFSSESYCSETYGPGDCYVRAIVDGQAAQPGGVEFDSFVVGSGGPQTHSMQWIATAVKPGNHLVKIQYQAFGGDANSPLTFGLGARTLTVLQSRL